MNDRGTSELKVSATSGCWRPRKAKSSHRSWDAAFGEDAPSIRHSLGYSDGVPSDDSSTRPSLVFHVGMPKTGSSYLQSMFALNRESLLSHGFLYPDSSSTREAELGLITSGNFPGWRLLKKSLEDTAILNAVTIFSSELMFTRLSRSESGFEWNLLKQLNGFFSVKILLLIRNPISQKVSQHQQLVKRHGLVENLDQWIRTEDLPKIFDFISAAKKNVDALQIINFSRHEHDLWETSLEAIGCPAGTEIDWRYPRNIRVNRSLSTSEMRIQIAANSITGWAARSSFLADQFCNFAPAVEPAEPALSEAGYAEFVSRIADDIGRINQLVPKTESLVVESFSTRWARAFTQSGTESLTVDLASWSALVSKIAEVSGKSNARVEAKLARHLRKPATKSEEARPELVLPTNQVFPLVRNVKKMSEPNIAPATRMVSRFLDRLHRFGLKWRPLRRALKLASKLFGQGAECAFRSITRSMSLRFCRLSFRAEQ